MTVVRPVQTRLIDGFDDPIFSRAQWNALLDRSASPSPYMTWEAQRTWHEVHGEGELLVVAAEREAEIVAVAPFRAEGGTVMFNGTTFEFDRLHVLGDVSDPDVVFALLDTARAHAPGFTSFYLEFVHDGSLPSEHLVATGARLGLQAEPLYDMVGLEIDFVRDPDTARDGSSSSARQVLKDERWLARNGRLEVNHFREPPEILQRLPALFDQHRRRRPGPEDPSRFHDEQVCRLFERLTELCGGTDLLRFSELAWDGRPIACHYGLALGGRWFMKAFSMEPELARRSPGGVLLRHVILAAQEEGAHAFDFGTGGQEFKRRYATHSWPVHGWMIAPPEWDEET